MGLFLNGGLLSHSFDKFYVVTKLLLSIIDDIKILPITFDMECSHLNTQLDKSTYAVKHTIFLFQNNTIYLLL